MENSDYIKKLERENEYLNKILRCSLWFRGIDNIKKPWIDYLKNHPKSLIDVGWFWFTEHGPEVVACIENAMEPGTVKSPLMCSIQYIHNDEKGNSGWFLYDGGTYKHPLETFRNYWFAGPLIAPYRDLIDG